MNSANSADDGGTGRRRVRRRASRSAGPPSAPERAESHAVSPDTGNLSRAGRPLTPADITGPRQSPPSGRHPLDHPGRAPAGRSRGDAGLHGLVGPGPSQLGVSGAMRARDVARASDQDDATAAAHLQVIRRNYRPPEDDSRRS